jgi:hypothetical protein
MDTINTLCLVGLLLSSVLMFLVVALGIAACMLSSHISQELGEE